MEEKQWYTIKDVCDYSKLSTSTIHRAIQRNILKVAKTGTGDGVKCGKLLFKKKWVDDFIMGKVSPSSVFTQNPL